MSTTRADEKGRILLSKEIRKIVGIRPKEQLAIRPFGKGKIILEKLPMSKQNIKTPIFGRPLHVSPKKLRKIDLEKIEEKMWSD